MKIPKRMGACADLLYKMRQDRLDLQKTVDQLKKDEAKLKDYIINNLPKSDATGVGGKTANVRVVTSVEPQVTDWDAFFAYARRKGNTDMLRRGINPKAIKDRWADDKTVPGVGEFNRVDVSCTKIPTK